MKSLRCDKIDADVEAIRKKYPHNRDVLEALEQAKDF